MMDSKKLILQNHKGEDVIVSVDFTFASVYAINKSLSTVNSEGLAENDGLINVYTGLVEHDATTLVALINVLSKNALSDDEIVNSLNGLFENEGLALYDSIVELAESSGFLTDPKGQAAQYLKLKLKPTILLIESKMKDEAVTDEEKQIQKIYLSDMKTMEKRLMKLTGSK